MRVAPAYTLFSVLCFCLAGCGYVGPVLPPSPEIPVAVTDLTVVERGGELIINFGTPSRTTDGLVVSRFSEIDLRIGTAPVPFDFDRWAASATKYVIEPPASATFDNPSSIVLSKTIPAADWVGKRVAVAVRSAVKKNDHYSSWSNRILLDVLPPLEPPSVTAVSTAKGVLLSWPGREGDFEYRIRRKASADKEPLQLGTSKSHEYLDESSQYETPYEYTVVAARGLAESLPSKPCPVTTHDIFPPSVPASITALAGPNSIEVSWQRSPEADLRGYFVLRSIDNGPYQPVGGLLTLPAFSDNNVEHGKTYRYTVSAVDQKNNRSDQSAPAAVSY